MKKAVFYNGFIPFGVIAVLLVGSMSVLSEETPLDSTVTNAASVIDTNLTQSAAQPADFDPDSAYAELVRLVLAGVDQGVIRSYVETSLRFFNLDADKIIYLTDLGTPAQIIESVMEHDKHLYQKGITPAATQSSESNETAINPPAEVTTNYFYETLEPYGGWVYVEGYGRCWRPTVVAYNSDWRPYSDNGRWVYTDCGWYWMSDYSWGWATFHYGRWFRHARYGWCWWPDTVWSPSWVCWRYDRDYCGWAPLPPYTSYRSGAGIVYRGSRVNAGFNFGLTSDCYTFIATRNFCDPKPWHHRLDNSDAARIYDRTRVFNKMDYDTRKKSVVNGGISPNVISILTRQNIKPVSIRHAGSHTENNMRYEQLNRTTQTLVVSRPDRAVPQRCKDTSTRMRDNTQRTTQSATRSLYTETAGRNNPVPKRETVRLPEVRVQRTAPSYARSSRPSTTSQARQSRTTPPTVATPLKQRSPQRPIPQQHANNGRTSVQSGNRSIGTASVRVQEKSRSARPSEPAIRKSNDAARDNNQAPRRSTNVANNGQ